jgi:hypothetical protein
MEAAAQEFNVTAAAAPTTAEAESLPVLDEDQREARGMLGKWYRWGVVCQWRRWAAGRAVWCEPGSRVIEGIDEEDGTAWSWTTPEWHAPELP